jgi:hypothetical protein
VVVFLVCPPLHFFLSRMMDNIIASKLYRPGSVGYVSRSGGMSNELNNILSLVTNGTYEGVALGGDRYPGTSFVHHLLRYEQDPDCKMLVLLGEVGGIEEYRVIDAVKQGKIRKPIVAWAIGTCGKMFATEVQFGHAGSMANSDLETADAKNKAMREAGFIVPDTFEELPRVLKETYESLVVNGTIKPKAEKEPPVIPMDYKWAQVRPSSSFLFFFTVKNSSFSPGTWTYPQACGVHLYHFGRAWSGIAVRRHAHLRRVQRRHRAWWRGQLVVVQTPAPAVRGQVHRDGAHADC